MVACVLLCCLSAMLVSSSSARPTAVPPSQLREFDNFLKATVDAEPDDEIEISLDSPQNPWEQSGKFEGDILLSDRQRSALVEMLAATGAQTHQRNGLNDVSKRWPEKTVVYAINKRDFNAEQISAIMDGMSDLERSSCVKFREKEAGDDNYVKIQGTPAGCYSHVGYQGRGAQLLNLAPHPPGLGCMRHGTIVHEMLHALGFFHMQSHTKRDDYVKIVWDNIINGRENNFKKYNSLVSTDFGVPYDYDSVLHYSQFAFSKNGKKTIVPLKDEQATIGQRAGMSDKDALKLNRMYKCDGGGGGSGGGSEFGGFSDPSGQQHLELQDNALSKLHEGLIQQQRQRLQHYLQRATKRKPESSEDNSEEIQKKAPQTNLYSSKYTQGNGVLKHTVGPTPYRPVYAQQDSAEIKPSAKLVKETSSDESSDEEEDDDEGPQPRMMDDGEKQDPQEPEGELTEGFPWRKFLPAFFNFEEWR